MLRVLPSDRWSLNTAAHLLNRAGFGGPPTEIEKLAALGLEQAVAHFVDYDRVADSTPNPAWAQPDPERAERLRAARTASPEERRRIQREEQKSQLRHLVDLRGWWLERMAKGPRPLQEKMVLFWHGHFATSAQKVRDAYLMWRQNELFRRLATGSWLELLLEVAKDPAMLVWLDQAQSRKEHPNENFAREVMELFALGEGHYTEKDVTEAARALTGWSYDRLSQKFIERPNWHDTGTKTIFGREGTFDGTTFLELVVAHPRAAEFITSKLWRFFAGDEPPPEVANALAASFRQAGCQFKPLLHEIFKSAAFYSPAVVRNQVKSPVQWLVGSVRVLERELPPPLVSSALIRNLGQDLFAPPNVKGWDGGLSWITTNTLLTRYNEAAALVRGDVSSLVGMGGGRRPNTNPAPARQLARTNSGTVDVEKVLTEQDRRSNDALIAALERRLLQGKLNARQERVLRDYLEARKDGNPETVRKAIWLVMSTPEYQLT